MKLKYLLVIQIIIALSYGLPTRIIRQAPQQANFNNNNQFAPPPPRQFAAPPPQSHFNLQGPSPQAQFIPNGQFFPNSFQQRNDFSNQQVPPQFQQQQSQFAPNAQSLPGVHQQTVQLQQAVPNVQLPQQPSLSPSQSQPESTTPNLVEGKSISFIHRINQFNFQQHH